MFDYGVSGTSASVHLGYRSHLCCNAIRDKSLRTLLVVSLTNRSVAFVRLLTDGGGLTKKPFPPPT